VETSVPSAIGPIAGGLIQLPRWDFRSNLPCNSCPEPRERRNRSSAQRGEQGARKRRRKRIRYPPSCLELPAKAIRWKRYFLRKMGVFFRGGPLPMRSVQRARVVRIRRAGLKGWWPSRIALTSRRFSERLYRVAEILPKAGEACDRGRSPGRMPPSGSRGGQYRLRHGKRFGCGSAGRGWRHIGSGV